MAPAFFKNCCVESRYNAGFKEILDESLARSANNILVAWDVESGDILHVEPLESVNHVSDYAISGNQKRIAITGFHEVTVLDLEDAG